jgi:hypothetical protein
MMHTSGLPSINVSNFLSEEKKRQIISLGKLGLSLRRIERTVDIRRETAADYLKAAGIAIRPPGGWGRRAPTKPANEVITDFGADSAGQKVVPAEPGPGRPSASASEAYRELIELGLSQGRNARAIWQDLVDARGFAAGYLSIQRYIRKLQGVTTPEACGVIETARVDSGSGPMVHDPQSGQCQPDFVSPLCRTSSLAYQAVTSPVSGTGLAIHDELLLRRRFCHGNGCHAVFWICRHCDRGQRYCSRVCRTLARLQQRRSANRRHQRSLEGRLDHRDRQRRYRCRWAQDRPRVTGQASISIVSPSSLRCGLAEEMLRAPSGSMIAEVPSSCEKHSPSQACCIVCGRTGSRVDPFPRAARCPVESKTDYVTSGG